MISVITPSFNQSEWLRLAIASVADQENVEVEHIVQDALSSDATRDWLPQRDDVRAYFEKDSGMCDAINRGFARARGEICAYLNCDEQYLPKTLATVRDFFDSNPSVDVVFGDVVLAEKDGEPVSYRRTILPAQSHLRVAHLNTFTCATFFRHRLLERGFSFDTKWRTIGDSVWMDNLLAHRVSMAVIPKPLSVFSFTGQNLGVTATAESERKRWHAEVGAVSGLKRLTAICYHRFQKMLAGAYWPPPVEIDIFTLRSPEKRQHFRQRRVGFGWPKG